MSISVVILAAGQGTRMKSSLPKVLHKISGREMLFHVIDAALGVSDDITVVLHHQYERIKEAVETEYDGIAFHRQSADTHPGTGGALMGLRYGHEKVLVLNGDMPLILPSSLEKLSKAEGDIAMSVIELEDPSGYGRVMINENGVREIVEEKDCSPEELKTRSVNAGVYLLDRELLHSYIPALKNDNAQGEYYLTDIISMAVEDGLKVTPVYVDEEEFKGVNSRYDLAEAEKIMQNRIRRRWMREGVGMQLPESIYIDCRARFEGECLLENGVRIEGECVIASSHIKAHSVVENSLLVESDVGPLAHIRPGCSIKKTHIGNFVEVKKGKLDGVKAGHLSYLGDCEIGEGSNIGAGTITCNYDGKAKHRTIIGKNVFIGSDTQLVAPLEVEDDVMIAAGTTVTKNLKKGVLALSRTPLKSIENFYYRFFGKKDER